MEARVHRADWYMPEGNGAGWLDKEGEGICWKSTYAYPRDTGSGMVKAKRMGDGGWVKVDKGKECQH